MAEPMLARGVPGGPAVRSPGQFSTPLVACGVAQRRRRRVSAGQRPACTGFFTHPAQASGGVSHWSETASKPALRRSAARVPGQPE